jgi:hypothetical protein
MKNKIFTRVSVMSLILTSFLSSCTQDSDTILTPPTNTELITSASWKFSSATVGGSDVSAFLQGCQKDNTMLFAAAGTGVADEGASKCNGADPQTTPFTWNYDTNETALHVSAILFTGGSSDFTLVSLSASQLVVSQAIDVSGSSQNAVVTFVH